MMSQRDFYTLELFSKIKPFLKQSFLLHCPTELTENFSVTVCLMLYMVELE